MRLFWLGGGFIFLVFFCCDSFPLLPVSSSPPFLTRGKAYNGLRFAFETWRSLLTFFFFFFFFASLSSLFYSNRLFPCLNDDHDYTCLSISELFSDFLFSAMALLP